MMTSPAYFKGTILQVDTAHNAFIEFFLDNGIILFLIMIFYIFKLLKLAWYNVKAINSDVGWALFVSIICYFIATISGRNIYPTPQNMFLFPIIALMVNYLRCKNEALN
jgi:O-antigen ligase